MLAWRGFKIKHLPFKDIRKVDCCQVKSAAGGIAPIIVLRPEIVIHRKLFLAVFVLLNKICYWGGWKFLIFFFTD